MKRGRDGNRKGLSNNSECSAIVSLKVKLSTAAIRRKDPFVKVQ
jgi:hypothetical protein